MTARPPSYPEIAPREDFRRGRHCLMCRSPYALRLIRTGRRGLEFWLCKNLEKCAAKMMRSDGLLVDWPCFHAEHLEEAPARVATDIPWAEWHLLRGELERAARHPAAAAVREAAR